MPEPKFNFHKFVGDMLKAVAVLQVCMVFPFADISTAWSANPTYINGMVDIHVHFGQNPLNGNIYFESKPENLIAWMDSNNVTKVAVQWGFTWVDSTTGQVDQKVKTSQLAAFAKFPTRMYPFCWINPRTPGTLADMERLLQEYKNAGAIGFGEHKYKVPINYSGSTRLYEACGNVGLPVLPHMDGSYNTDDAMLTKFESVLKAYPKCIFIGHANAFWDTYRTGRMDTLLKKYPNLMCDISAGSGGEAVTANLNYTNAFVARWPDRCMLGTDHPAVSSESLQFNLVSTQIKDAAIARKIASDNAYRIFPQMAPVSVEPYKDLRGASLRMHTNGAPDRVMIFDASGRMVSDFRNTPAGLFTLRREGMAPGVYYVKTKFGAAILSRSVVVHQQHEAKTGMFYCK